MGSRTSSRTTALSAALAALAVLPVTLFFGGCSLVSGWSDLQDGTRTTADGGVDSSTLSPPPAGDSGSTTTSTPDSATNPPPPGSDSGSVTPVDTSVACGSERCPYPQVCCAQIEGQGETCQQPSQSCPPPGVVLPCSSSAACTTELGQAEICCATTTDAFPTVACVASCSGVGAQIVCDPAAADAGCPAGETCKPEPDGFGYYDCSK